MKWTKEVPTRRGWYWYRRDQMGEAMILFAYGQEGRALALTNFRNDWTGLGKDFWYTDEPIQMPEYSDEMNKAHLEWVRQDDIHKEEIRLRREKEDAEPFSIVHAHSGFILWKCKKCGISYSLPYGEKPECNC